MNSLIVPKKERLSNHQSWASASADNSAALARGGCSNVLYLPVIKH